MQRCREDEERRTEMASHFQAKLTDIQAQIEQHSARNDKLCSENANLTHKLELLVNQCEVREEVSGRGGGGGRSPDHTAGFQLDSDGPSFDRRTLTSVSPRPQSLEKIDKHHDLQLKLSEAKLQQAAALLADAEEKHKREKEYVS